MSGGKAWSDGQRDARSSTRSLMAWLVLLLAIAFNVSAPRVCLAEEDKPPAKSLRYDLRFDIPVTVFALALWESRYLADYPHPAKCRLCEPNAFDEAARDGLRWSGHRTTAALISDGVGLYGLPALTVGALGAMEADADVLSSWWVDAMVFVQAMAMAENATYLAKLVSARTRPFVYARAEDEGIGTKADGDNMSFYSGHTSRAFSVVAAAATIASLRRYRYAKWVWFVGLPLATLTGYMRIAADRHYLSDVLTGAVMGTAFGVFIPWLHRPDAPPMSVSFTNSALAVTWRR